MSFSSALTVINIDTGKTAGQTEVVTGLGFQPKLVMFFWSGALNGGQAIGGGDAQIGFGACTSATERFAISNRSNDNAPSAVVGTLNRNDCCIANAANAVSVDGRLDCQSIDADGYTLEYDEQFASALKVLALAIGGSDISDVAIGSAQWPATTGNYDVTSLSFQPTALVCATTRQTIQNTVNTVGNFSLGFASGAAAQGVAIGFSQSAAATSLTKGYGYDGEIMGFLSSSEHVDGRHAFVSFLSNGFRINNLEGTFTSYYYYIAIKGPLVKVGAFNTRTDFNDISVSTGFKPRAILFASANRALSTQDVPTNHNQCSIGAAISASERGAQAIFDENNLADTKTGYGYTTGGGYLNIWDDAQAGAMDINSVGLGGFVAAMDDPDIASSWVLYLALGALDLEVDLQPSTTKDGPGVRIYP